MVEELWRGCRKQRDDLSYVQLTTAIVNNIFVKIEAELATLRHCVNAKTGSYITDSNKTTRESRQQNAVVKSQDGRHQNWPMTWLMRRVPNQQLTWRPLNQQQLHVMMKLWYSTGRERATARKQDNEKQTGICAVVSQNWWHWIRKYKTKPQTNHLVHQTSPKILKGMKVD